MIEQQTKQKLMNFSKQQINSKSLDQLLNVEGYPLWLFFREMFLNNHIPNRFFNYSFKRLINYITKKDKHSFLKNIYYFLNSLLVRKLFVMNELTKLFIRKFFHKRKKNPNKKILFYTQTDKILFGEDKILKFGNFIKQVKKNNYLDTYILAYSPIHHLPSIKLLNCDHMIYDYLNIYDLLNCRKKAKQLSLYWKKISNKKKIDLLKIKSISLWPVIKNELNYLFSWELLFIILLYVKSLKHIYIIENIKGAVTIGPGDFYGKPLFISANQLKIPTFVMQHGLCFGNVEVNHLKNTIFSVFGKKTKEELIDWGIPSRNIFITGPSIFDEIIPFINSANNKKIGKTIVFMTNGCYSYGLIDEREYFNLVERWINQIKSVGDIKIIFKLHPEEFLHIAKYRAVVNDTGFKNIFVNIANKKDIIYNIINQSDIIINYGSTVALEAMILNKPVITITNLYKSKLTEFDVALQRILNSGASINVNAYDNLAESINSIFNDKTLQQNLKYARETFVEESCFKIDGNAAKRTADLLYKILSKNSNFE